MKNKVVLKDEEVIVLLSVNNQISKEKEVK